MDEIWKDVKGYEGLYKVSNTGKIYSCRTNKLLRFDTSSGYYRCHLCNNGNHKKVYIHRIVAETFLPNPENKPEVNHIDQNPHNNNASNLEWTTPLENMKSYYNSPKSKKAIEKIQAKADAAGRYKTGFTYKHFGKRAKDLTEEEKKECNKAKNRERNKTK